MFPKFDYFTNTIMIFDKIYDNCVLLGGFALQKLVFMKKKKKLMDDLVVNYPNIITVIIIITHLFIDSKFKLTPIRTSIYNNLFLCKANWDQIYIIPSIETTNNLNLVTIIKKSDNANKWNCQTLIVIRWFI